MYSRKTSVRSGMSLVQDLLDFELPALLAERPKVLGGLSEQLGLGPRKVVEHALMHGCTGKCGVLV